MAKLQHSQEEIFSSYSWWDKSCLLNHITKERCDYIESCVDKVFGREALRQQEVLEIGCGGGLICENLLQRGAVTVGIDPSHKALEAARTHTQQSGFGHNAYYEHGYAEALPYANGSFSVIVCLDVLEHVSDLPKTIREITRVLAPGGIFIFDTINRTLIARIALIWIGERFFRNSGLLPGLHNYHDFIKPQELQGLLAANQLQVREMVGFMPHFNNGHLSLGPGWFKGVSYIGYATKDR
ncbi:MAG: 3-demethylubiquinone-9 3-O-methyltransferase [Chloroflexi bacterium]|nr:3-demethylubiquinone-9 3-O-methyltransferase [Chloroflexota bacterium]